MQLVEELVTRTKAAQDALARASMESPLAYADYLANCGQWQGMEMTIKLVEDLMSEEVRQEAANP